MQGEPPLRDDSRTPARAAPRRTPNMIVTIGLGTLRVLGSILALPFVRLPKPPHD